jgi:hypothetical protein
VFPVRYGLDLCMSSVPPHIGHFGSRLVLLLADFRLDTHLTSGDAN